jgi:hypothetical protein
MVQTFVEEYMRIFSVYIFFGKILKFNSVCVLDNDRCLIVQQKKYSPVVVDDLNLTNVRYMGSIDEM